jgi:hypothetical protein
MARQPLGGLGLLIFWGFTITLIQTIPGRTPLDDWPPRRRDLYLTTHNTHKRQTSMPSVGFEPAIPVTERPQTDALDRRPLRSACHKVKNKPDELRALWLARNLNPAQWIMQASTVPLQEPVLPGVLESNYSAERGGEGIVFWQTTRWMTNCCSNCQRLI